LFLNLLLGHLLGDFVLQPGRLVVAKRDGVPGLMLHTGIVGACCALATLGTLQRDWPAVVLVTGMHLVIERLTIATYLRTPTRGLFTLVFDQVLHVLSIGLVVWLTGPWSATTTVNTFGFDIPARALMTLDGLLATGLLGSIVAFETTNALLQGEQAKGRILRFDLERVLGMVERGTAFLAAVLWHPAAILIPFIPRLALSFRSPQQERARRAVEAAAGIALCLFVYAAVEILGLVASGDTALAASLARAASDFTSSR
jgi:hypothetical protein